MEYILYDKVTAELAHFFENNPAPDYITFSGSGEPTLNSRIGDVLKFIKKTKPAIPVAVLTNGTLFYDKQVRSEILDADVVLPSLDAASQEVFDKINRPNQSLGIAEYIDGIVTFRNEYKGKIWLEVLIMPGYNDSEDELILLKDAFKRIKPDSIQVNTLDRPGTVENLRPATRAELQRVVDFWDMDIAEIISAAPDRKNIKSYREDVETAILETIFRRPCTVDDLVKILGRHINEVNKYLDVLEAEGKIEHVRQERGVFYKVVKS
jgi:wyosine [tRNA(Phe)-imidazoG37] synthetase (radical SAM superfamily)